MSSQSAIVVLEEVLCRAMDEGLELSDKGRLSERDEGALMAYFTLLNCGKLQAEIFGIEFPDSELQAFDPYVLLSQHKSGNL